MTIAQILGQAKFGELVNPLAHASVKPERIDMGVDYAGTGTLGAIARGVVTVVDPSGWGSYGGYIAYRITDRNTPLYGQTIYYAEGVRSRVKVGQVVQPGQPVADLIPGWHSGIEIGFGSGPSTRTYAAVHGGYSEGQTTAAGVEFSKLVKLLGGPAGVQEDKTIVGQAPAVGIGPGAITSAITGVASGVGSAVSTAVGAAGAAVDVGTAIAGFLSNPVPALLTAALVLLGAALMYSGVGHVLGYDAPIRDSLAAARSRVSQAEAAA